MRSPTGARQRARLLWRPAGLAETSHIQPRASRPGPPCLRPRRRPRYLLMYLAGAVASTAASFAFSPSMSLGASGAIFGLGGALAVYFLRNR